LRRSPRGTRHSAGIAALVATLLGTAAILSGCGATTTNAADANTSGGKELFTEKCAGCHALADAGSLGQTGPNLDHAFGPAREDGFAENTFFEVTLEKMKIPGYGSVMPDFDEEDDRENYLTDEELVDVAAYIASVAGIEPEGDGGQGADDPKALFTQACGSCHTLADAETSGTTGPDLDAAKPDLEGAIQQIANGGNGMPAFKDQLTEEQIRSLAQYLVEATGRR
jgi:mono/diheme cytochrome c family protein